jgi:UDP-N-acetylmuramyl pentapeptide phosphotransferase/UDP-N-acetylglucosamine-1-phosphate transferase
MMENVVMDVQASLLVVVAAFGFSAGLVKALMPLLQHYALARPNARSSHSVPTPQGGGLAVMMATVLIVVVMLILTAKKYPVDFAWPYQPLLLLCGVGSLVAVGMADDILQLGVKLRLVVQVLAAGLIVSALPVNLIFVSWLPASIIKLLLGIGLIWFINLTNFMDGIDGITVAEMVPVVIGVLLVLHFGSDASVRLSVGIEVPALALLGGLLGFAPYNRHVAKVFLGDVGSLPIGALVGWYLIILAGRGHWAAAIILPLYYLTDATLTLGRRWWRGENLAEAHRSHFYQLATQRGFSVPAVTGRIWLLNGILVLLAIMTVRQPSLIGNLLALACAGMATGWLLVQFERGRS